MIYNDLLGYMRIASLLEISVDKPGNVGPTQIVKNIRIQDYFNVIDAIGLRAHNFLLSSSSQTSLGELVFSLVDAMMGTFPHQNLLLGQILLFSPLLLASLRSHSCSNSSFLPVWDKFWQEVRNIITTTTPIDAIWFVKAIKNANPGGLINPGGKPLHTQFDIFDPLIEQRIRESHNTIYNLVLESASFDSISQEYVDNYPLSRKIFSRFFSVSNYQDPNLMTKEKLILTLFLHILAENPDSLIYRKNSLRIATEIQTKAQVILSEGGISSFKGFQLLTELSTRLNSSNGLLNPGTTADITANVIFLALIFRKWPFLNK